MHKRPLPVMRLTVAITIMGLINTVCAAADSELIAGIEKVLAEESLAGIAWSLVDEDGTFSVNATGLQDMQTALAFNSDTQFHVGSLTKTVLATGVLRLATEGRIDLDAPASRYLPDITFNNAWADSTRVTVRHLLDHTAGLNDAQMWQMFSERPTPDTPLINAFPNQKDQLQIRSRPGERFSYSNTGYTVLGMIIESVVGRRYESYLDQSVLLPLEMLDSTFAFTTQEGAGADPMLAWGHVDDGSRYPASPVFLRPAAQFTSTAADLARFAQFMLGDGMVDGQPFIEKALMRSRGRPAGSAAANAGLEAGYALGLGRRDRHGVIGYCHGGNIVGFVAMLCIFPADNKAFAYSVNTDSETADYGRLNNLFIDALGITAATLPPTGKPAPDISEWHGRYLLSPNRFATMQYLDNVFGAIEISAANDSLLMSSLQQDPRELRPLGEQIYSAGNRITASHVFHRGANGEYLISDGFKTFEKTSPAYLIAHWISVALGMAGLAWLLLAGIIALARFRSRLPHQTIAPAFIAIVLLVVPIPFFMTQSFMALGDLTLASSVLAVVTLLLPVGMLLTLMRAFKSRQTSRWRLIHGAAAVGVLQWCAVLFAGGMLPLALWKL